MAKVKLNPVLENLRGQVGDLVFKRYQDEVIISRKPSLPTNPVSSPEQVGQRERFRQAARYGKAVFDDPALKALYEQQAEAKGLPPFAVTVSDYLNAPTIDEINLSAYAGKVGDIITIRASDDFAVVSVDVVIRLPDTTVLEQGPATYDRGYWRYTATQGTPAGQLPTIEVTALDRPGNRTTEMRSLAT